MDRIYTTPTFLLESGYNLDDLSPYLRWKLIRDVSVLIDQLTNQWFNPEYGEFYLSGASRSLIRHASDIPINGVTKIELVGDRTNNLGQAYGDILAGQRLDPMHGLIFTGPVDGIALSTDEWAMHPRAIERIRGVFPGGVGNIKVTGVLGWIEGYKSVTATSTAVVDADSDTIEVDNVAGFGFRDVVDIIGENDSARVIITNISREDSTLSFDPLGMLIDPIEIGATVRTFGRTPRGIEMLANYLFGAALRERGSISSGEVPIDPTRIKKETTDDYSYELFDPSSGAAMAMVTGSLVYDQILRGYSAPGTVRMI